MGNWYQGNSAAGQQWLETRPSETKTQGSAPSVRDARHPDQRNSHLTPENTVMPSLSAEHTIQRRPSCSQAFTHLHWPKNKNLSFWDEHTSFSRIFFQFPVTALSPFQDQSNTMLFPTHAYGIHGLETQRLLVSLFSPSRALSLPISIRPCYP